MFVKIHKDEKTLIVSEGAFNSYYKNSGWVVEEDKKANDVAVESQGSFDEDWDSIIEDDEPTKPLSEMNGRELREFAESKGIDLTGLSSNKQIREAIKAYI